MNKKATRLLSVLLAVLMVVTMVPFMALSAAEPVQNIAADPVVWDGKVPASSDGTVATVEEWIFGTGAAEGKTYDFNWSAEYAGFGEQFGQYEHIEFNGTDTITIKTAAGLALFTVWSNVNTTTVQGMGTKFGNGAGMTHPLVFLQGKTVKLAADLYLNDPAVDPAEWTNEVMPILWDNMDLTNAEHRTSFTFDGAGYMIYGWKVDQTIVYDATNCQNFGWGLFGQLPTVGDGVVVKNLAMIGQEINLDATVLDPDTTVLDVEGTVEDAVESGESNGLCSIFVGGIYGFAIGKVKVENCFIDITSNIDGKGNGSFGSGNQSYTNANFSAIGALHSNPTVYKELVAADNTGVKVADNTNAPRRTFVNCAILMDSTIATSQGSWRSPGYNTGLGIQGWGNTASLNDILVMKAALTGGAERGPLTLKGNTHTGCYGLVSVAAGDCLKDPSNKVATLGDMIGAFDTAVKTEVAGVRTTFDTWTWTKDTVPMPIEFNAADFIDAQYNEIYKIATPEDMMYWAANAADIPAVSLVADIDMAGYDWTPIQTWGGAFEGNGHTISNLTSTAQPVTDTNWQSYNVVDNMRGGLVNVAGDGLTFKNVAFLNYTFNGITSGNGSHCGMLVGYYGNGSITFDSVIVAGRGYGAKLLAMFAARGTAWNGKVTINNCAFICTDPAGSNFSLGLAGAAKDKWASYGGVTVTNFYGVNLPDGALETGFNGSNEAASLTAATNIYATGAQDRPYTYITTTETNDTPVTYKSTGDAAFYEAIGDRDIVKGDFVGEALPLGDAWTYADGLLPVPKCFDASVAELLTATNGIKADDASDYLTFTGASIRLSELAEKQGIRFSFATTAALDLLAKNADVMYGVLVAPTALIGEELNDEDELAALFLNLEGGDAVLDVVDGKFNAALVNFAGVTTGDVRTVSFTVRGFIMVGEEILWLESYACSAADVAKAYIAENAGSEDAEVLATIEKIEAIYSDLLAE